MARPFLHVVLSCVWLFGVGCASGVPFAASYTLDFGTVQVGAISTRTLDLTNESGGTTSILSIDPSNDHEFTSDQPTPVNATAGATLSLPVSFQPFSSGAKRGVFVVHTDSADRPTIQVIATGSGGEPCLQLSTATLDFGNVLVGSTETRSLDLVNCGGLDLALTPSQIQGPSSSLFRLGQPLTSVAAGGMLSVPVIFAPDSPAIQDTGYFVISLTSLAPSMPATIALQGAAVLTNLSVTPSPLDCGTIVTVGTTTQLQLSLSNVANQVVHVFTVDIFDPGSPPAFLISSQSWIGGVLNPGEQKDIFISFEPPAPGIYSGEVEIRSDDAAGTIKVKLSCTANP
jgi:hypothetical protein